MASFTIADPYDLKPADVYRQAKVVASKTSRASDGNWYKEPGEIACQWHLWFDGGRDVCSATFSRAEGVWRQGPSLPLASLTTAEGIKEILGELLDPKYFGVRPKALGVILHVADEFALTEIAPPSENSGDPNEELGLLRYNLVDSPKECLADREVSLDTTSWRLFPFWGAAAGSARGVAIALPRNRETFLSRMIESGEQWRLPIRVCVTCAPLEAITTMTACLPEVTGGCLIVLPYLKFTAVFTLTPTGELRAARSLSHRGNNTVPASFGDILWNIAVGAELVVAGDTGPVPPKIIVASANPAQMEETMRELEIYSISRQKLDCRKVDLTTVPATSALPGCHPEFLLYDPKHSITSGSESPLARTETFKALWSGWAGQNFFHTAKVDSLYPSLADLRLLKLATWFVYFLTFSFIGVAVYTTYSLFAAMNHPSWNLTPEEVKATEAKNMELIAEERRIDITERLLLPRSKGWSNVEMMLQLFPEESGVRLETFSYSLDSTMLSAKKVIPMPPTPGAPAAAPGKENVGLERQWSFKGLAKSKGLNVLNNLNSQRGLTSFFTAVAEATKDASFAPSAERQLRITLTQSRNPRFSATASAADAAREPTIAFPYTFEATVFQTFSEKDPLAVPVPKPF